MTEQPDIRRRRLVIGVASTAGASVLLGGLDDYSKPDKPGMYRCICCDTALYDAATQFHSGTGWPSFWQPIAKDNVSRHTDHSFGSLLAGTRWSTTSSWAGT